MILRRMSEHFRRQDWFAVGVEFILVLSSVVVGFQVTAWAEARQDRAEARLLIERVADELDRSLETIDEALPVARSGMEGTALAHAMLTGPGVSAENRARFEEAFLATGWLSEIRISRSALEVYQTSTAANEATPPDLRHAIARYYEFVVLEREQDLLLLADYMELVRVLFSRIDVGADYFETGTIHTPAATLNNDPELARTLLQIYLRQEVQHYRLQIIREEIVALKERLDALD